MSGYYVFIDARIDEPEEYREFIHEVGPVVGKYGGEILVRGGVVTTLEGAYYRPRRIVLLRFPDKATFEAYYASEDYQAARNMRLPPVADVTIVGIEGYEG